MASRTLRAAIVTSCRWPLTARHIPNRRARWAVGSSGRPPSRQPTRLPIRWVKRTARWLAIETRSRSPKPGGTASVIRCPTGSVLGLRLGTATGTDRHRGPDHQSDSVGFPRQRQPTNPRRATIRWSRPARHRHARASRESTGHRRAHHATGPVTPNCADCARLRCDEHAGPQAELGTVGGPCAMCDGRWRRPPGSCWRSIRARRWPHATTRRRQASRTGPASPPSAAIDPESTCRHAKPSRTGDSQEPVTNSIRDVEKHAEQTRAHICRRHHHKKWGHKLW